MIDAWLKILSVIASPVAAGICAAAVVCIVKLVKARGCNVATEDQYQFIRYDQQQSWSIVVSAVVLLVMAAIESFMVQTQWTPGVPIGDKYVRGFDVNPMAFHFVMGIGRLIIAMVGLFIAAIFGNKASKLKKAKNIESPVKVNIFLKTVLVVVGIATYLLIQIIFK